MKSGLLDDVDLKILRYLSEEGRMSFAALARKVKLSTPAVHRRVRALEERGVIRSYRADVQPESLGLGVMAYVSLNIDGGQFGRVREIESSIRDFPQILECHTVSGDYDYLLKVVARDLKSLSQFLTDRLMQVPGVDDVRSMICMEEVKASAPLPVDLVP